MPRWEKGLTSPPAAKAYSMSAKVRECACRRLTAGFEGHIKVDRNEHVMVGKVRSRMESFDMMGIPSASRPVPAAVGAASSCRSHAGEDARATQSH